MGVPWIVHKARKTAGGPVQLVEAALSADPQISPTIFVDAKNVGVAQAVGILGIVAVMDEPSGGPVQAIKPAFGSDP
jgi:hypothetical protein